MIFQFDLMVIFIAGISIAVVLRYTSAEARSGAEENCRYVHAFSKHLDRLIMVAIGCLGTLSLHAPVLSAR